MYVLFSKTDMTICSKREKIELHHTEYAESTLL